MKLRAAVVGATGIAGQQFLAALGSHPSIEVVQLAASARSAGKRYIDAITSPQGQICWWVDQAMPEKFASMPVVDGSALDLSGLDLVFSAVESDAARDLEAAYSVELPVISTASAFRYEDDVPILIPAVNGQHAELIKRQQAERNIRGFVVPIPNCTTTGLAIALAPLVPFGLEKVIMTSMQALSGAGKSPGVVGLDILDNIIPYIPKEEQKVERETKKILGALEGNAIRPASVRVSCHCTRVAVLESHFETVTVSYARPAGVDEVKRAMRAFGKEISPKTHPSAPENWITVLEDPYRPQPRLDRLNERGMTTTVGRVREENVLGDHGVRFSLVSHNTRMGAALGAVLVAEDLMVRGLIRGR